MNICWELIEESRQYLFSKGCRLHNCSITYAHRLICIFHCLTYFSHWNDLEQYFNTAYLHLGYAIGNAITKVRLQCFEQDCQITLFQGLEFTVCLCSHTLQSKHRFAPPLENVAGLNFNLTVSIQAAPAQTCDGQAALLTGIKEGMESQAWRDQLQTEKHA